LGETLDKTHRRRYQEYLKAELKAAGVYDTLAKIEKNSGRADVFRKLVAAEMRHAARWAERLGIDTDSLVPERSALKTRSVGWSARLFGIHRVLPILLREEGKEIDIYAADPEAQDLVGEERAHAQLLQQMAYGRPKPSDITGVRANRMLKRGGSIRAAVLGVNDGLVSNFSLVMGVAGGTGGDREFILLAGIAGLLAGAFSMAAGEYVSVRSQRDVYEFEIHKEKMELDEFPDEEEEELALIYQAKGLSEDDSRHIAKHVMADPNVALDTMAREELGLDPDQLGEPWTASMSSFASFVAGAFVPIASYVITAGDSAFYLSAGLSAAALATIGAAIGRMSGRNATWSGLRMLAAGSAAATVTFGVGKLIGISLT